MTIAMAPLHFCEDCLQVCPSSQAWVLYTSKYLADAPTSSAADRRPHSFRASAERKGQQSPVAVGTLALKRIASDKGQLSASSRMDYTAAGRDHQLSRSSHLDKAAPDWTVSAASYKKPRVGEEKLASPGKMVGKRSNGTPNQAASVAIY